MAAAIALLGSPVLAGNLDDVGPQGGPDGGAGGNAIANEVTSDLTNTASATGGAGGGGTNGATGNGENVRGGDGGAGGPGGSANAHAGNNPGPGSVVSSASAVGGAGGQGGSGGSGGPPAGPSGKGAAGGAGGDATASASGQNTSADSVSVSASALGGAGGSGGGGADGSSAPGAPGGIATLGSVFGSSTGGGAVSVQGSVQGGNGGDTFTAGSAGGDGRDAAASNKVDGSTTGTLSLSQNAQGGNGGGSNSGFAGRAGNATSSLIYTKNDLAGVSASVITFGGFGGSGFGSSGSGGGNANSTADITSNSPLVITAGATGGTGGSASSASSGDGADAFSTSRATDTSTVLGQGVVTVTSIANGGNGGIGGSGDSSGGNGAAGNATGQGINATSDPVTVTVTAAGGSGGDSGGNSKAGNGGFGFLGSGGTGGGPNNSSSAVIARSTGGGQVLAQGFAYGGSGGSSGGAGASGDGASEFLNNLFTDPSTANTTGILTVSQYAQAGSAGSAGGGGVSGAAGDATSSLTMTRNGLEQVNATVSAFAGNGGNTLGQHGGNSGFGSATITLLSDSNLSATAMANIPAGGFGPPVAGAAMNGVSGDGGSGTATASAIGSGTLAGHSSVTVTANAGGAYGGSGGSDALSSSTGGRGGDANAIAVGSGSGPDLVSVSAIASAGNGGNGTIQGFVGGAGGNGGDATAGASAIGLGNGDVQVIANATGGIGGASSGKAGLGIAVADGTASFFGHATVTATSTGSDGLAKSYATAENPLSLVFKTRGSVEAAMDRTITSKSIATIGSAGAATFGSMSGDGNAFVTGLPAADDVTSNWSSSPRVQAAFNNDPSVAKGLGAVGLIHTNQGSGRQVAYRALCDFFFGGNELTSNDRLLAGLLSAPTINGGLGAGDTLQFVIARNGEFLINRTFTSNAEITDYFTDTAFNLGLALKPGETSVDVTVGFDLVSSIPGNGVEANFLVGTSGTALTGVWNNPQGGSWASASNWQNYLLPSGPGAQVTFGTIINGDVHVTLDENTTVGGIFFDDTFAYAITPGFGDNSLILDNAGNTSTITVNTGHESISAPIVLKNNLTVTTSSPNTSLRLAGDISGTGSINLVGTGTVTISGSGSYVGDLTVSSTSNLVVGDTLTAGALSPTGQLISNGTTTFERNPSTGILPYKLAGLTITSSGRVTLNGQVSTADREVLSLGSLSLAGTTDAWQGILDLNNNDAIIRVTDLGTIKNQIKQGYNGGAWNGTGGIRSTFAAFSDAAHRTALGYALAGDIGAGTFDNQPVDPTDVLIRYTFAGDANLDGTVTTADFTRLATDFGGAGVVWSDGDFNYDGTVNALDFNLLATNYGQVMPSDRVLGSVVPEPQLLAGLLSCFLIRRRGRR